MAESYPPKLLDQARGAERQLAIGYAPAGRQAGLAALLDLDGRLGDILRTTREPLVGQMRLTWWHDALARLGAGPVPAEPVLVALAAAALPCGIAGTELARLIDGWEALLDGASLDAAALGQHAQGRGATLFLLAARMLDAGDDRVAAAGEGWALADLAGHLSDAAAAGRARGMAVERLEHALAVRWSRAGRPLGALARSALMDLAVVPRAPAHPLRVARLLRHRLTGR